jgi:hypothetical protein
MENLAWNRNILRDGAVKFLGIPDPYIVNQINLCSKLSPVWEPSFEISFLRLINFPRFILFRFSNFGNPKFRIRVLSQPVFPARGKRITKPIIALPL